VEGSLLRGGLRRGRLGHDSTLALAAPRVRNEPDNTTLRGRHIAMSNEELRVEKLIREKEFQTFREYQQGTEDYGQGN
jgi:hypothetical protein